MYQYIYIESDHALHCIGVDRAQWGGGGGGTYIPPIFEVGEYLRLEWPVLIIPQYFKFEYNIISTNKYS